MSSDSEEAEMSESSEVMGVLESYKSAPAAFRESDKFRRMILDHLPEDSDWSVALVAEFIRQSSVNRIVVSGRHVWFSYLKISTQYAICRSVLDQLVKEGLVERAIGLGVSGREAMTYNAVRKVQ